MRIKIIIIFAIIFLALGNRQTIRATFELFYETETTFLFCFDRTPEQIFAADANDALLETIERRILSNRTCETRVRQSFVFSGEFVFESVRFLNETGDFGRILRVLRLGIKLSAILFGES